MRWRVGVGVLVGMLAGGCVQQTPLDYYLQGQLAAGKGDLPTAMEALNKAIEESPTLGVAYMARGEVRKAKGDYEQAAADFTRVTQLEPHNFHAFYQLGLMDQYLKRFVEAVAAYQQAVAIRPMDAGANMNLALVYEQTGEPLRGLPYAQRAVSGSPDLALAHTNLGRMYAQVGYTDLAIAEFKRSIELSGREPEVYVHLAMEYLKRGRFEQARNVLETARAMGPAAAVSERLGLCYYKLGEIGKAQACYLEASRLDPMYPPAFNGLGVMAMTLSLRATPPDTTLAREALAYWRRSLEIQPGQGVIRKLVDKYGGEGTTTQ